MMWKDKSIIASVSVAAKCTATVWYKYTDEDQSYREKEEQCYLWQSVVEHEYTYEVSFNMELSLDISDWLPSVEEKQDVVFEEYLDMPSTIVLREEDLISVEDLTEYPVGGRGTDCFEGYTNCPDCGDRITEDNDGGNGFCSRCAVNHRCMRTDTSNRNRLNQTDIANITSTLQFMDYNGEKVNPKSHI